MWTYQLPLLLLLLVFSACFSSIEAAFFSLNRVQQRRLERDGRSSSRRVLRLLARPRDLLITSLTGNTLVNIAISTVATGLFLHLFGENGIQLAILAATPVVLLFGELTPKTVAVNFPEAMCRILVTPFVTLRLLLSPLVGIVTLLSRGALRLLRAEEKDFEATPRFSRGELGVLLEGEDVAGIMSAQESKLVQNILEFSTTRAEEVMTPRVDVVAAPHDLSRDELRDLVVRAKHSRIPIYRQTIDDLSQFVKTRDLLLHPERRLDELLKPALIYPNRAPISQIFYEMQRRRAPLVIVVNEYGETVGILTREDLLEELVGEIYDEYEAREAPLHRLEPGRWSASGQLNLEELNAALDLELPVEDAYTLNGFLCALEGGIPKRGARLEHEDVTFIVTEVSRHRVQRCLILLEEPEPAPAEGEAPAAAEDEGSWS